MKYRFYTLDVFTDRTFAGNPLAVFPWAEGLDERKMQSIAKEFNLSETVFVFQPSDQGNTRRVRIFTPGGELQFAGHPTVGTGFLLAKLGEVEVQAGDTRIVLEEGVGPVPVAVHQQHGQLVGATLSVAKLPEKGPRPPAPEEIAAVLSLTPSDLMTGEYEPEAYSCGTPFLFIPVRDRAVLARTRPDYGQWQRGLSDYWASRLYVIAFDPELSGSDVRARMFKPSGGMEDPATGSAAASIAGYLAARSTSRDGTVRWQIEQGFEIGRPSILRVEADLSGGMVTAVRVGGGCVLVSEGEMEVPS